MSDSFSVHGVNFQRTTMNSVKKDILPKMLFFMISQSGALDRVGTIYFFTPTAAFFMDKEDYNEDFKEKLFLYTSKWNLLNAYFCDFLIIRPDIYDSFVLELCLRNQPYFWFDTAIEIYGHKYY